jgi:hypothetical protein
VSRFGSGPFRRVVDNSGAYAIAFYDDQVPIKFVTDKRQILNGGQTGVQTSLSVATVKKHYHPLQNLSSIECN